MSAHKAYVKNMLIQLRTGQFTKIDVITEMFTNSAEHIKDADIFEQVKQSALYLVENGITTADQMEEILRQTCPDLVGPKQVGPTLNNSPFGPFPNNRKPQSPIIVDMSRLGKDVIKLQDTNPALFEQKMRIYQKEFDERQRHVKNRNNNNNM
jgi:hypothetical protein